jgi:hypothetical protein
VPGLTLIIRMAPAQGPVREQYGQCRDKPLADLQKFGGDVHWLQTAEDLRSSPCLLSENHRPHCRIPPSPCQPSHDFRRRSPRSICTSLYPGLTPPTIFSTPRRLRRRAT